MTRKTVGKKGEKGRRNARRQGVKAVKSAPTNTRLKLFNYERDLTPEECSELLLRFSGIEALPNLLTDLDDYVPLRNEWDNEDAELKDSDIK